MFKHFTHRQTDCTVDEEFRYGEGIDYGSGYLYNGVSDKVILSRERQSSTILQKEYGYNGLFSSESVVKPGALVKTKDTYFVMTMRETTQGDKYCSMLKTNVVVEIQRYSQQYAANDRPMGDPEFLPVQTHIIGYAQYVSAQLRQEDIGLLPTTRITLYLHTTANIKRPQEVSSPDRVVFNGMPYQVDVIDDIKLPNILCVQLSEDTR